MYFESRFDSPIGPLILLSRGDSLVYCNWDNEECEPKLRKVRDTCWCPCIMKDDEILKCTKVQLREYFEGKRQNFEVPYHLTSTGFQLKIFKAIGEIPYGDTISYKELGEKSGFPKGYRAIAGACGANPIALILPCHRVVGSNGLGGYTGGIDKKVFLLSLERNSGT